jgi:hypothetical protein
MYGASLPSGLREELGGALGRPQTRIRDDQPNNHQATLLESLQELSRALRSRTGTAVNVDEFPDPRDTSLGPIF